MTNKERDELYDVVWAGEVGLIGDRDSKPDVAWSPIRRPYNFSGKYVGLFKSKKKVKALGNEEEPAPKIDTFGDGETD